MPQVTVVIPNYNHARFLAQRIDSILCQTYQDFEVLYLDDASTDDSAEVFAAYADNPRVRAIVNTQNTGSPFVQWNRGVREARGKYVWIAEADDFADPRLLETLVAKLDAYPNVGLAYCQSCVVDEHGTPLYSAVTWTQPLDTTHWHADFVGSGQDECRRFLVRDNTIPNASAVLFRKSVYEQIGGADEAMRASGDWYLYAKILLVSDIAFCAEPLNSFRRHSLSVTHHSAWNGQGLQESYQVVSFIASRIKVDPAMLNLSCRGRMGDWHRIVLSDQSSIPWRRNWEIYQLARRVDMLIHVRLAKLLPLLVWGAIKRRVRPAARPDGMVGAGSHKDALREAAGAKS